MKGPPFTVTLWQKGQLSVPAWIVRKLGWKSGTKLEVTVIGEEEFLVRRASNL